MTAKMLELVRRALLYRKSATAAVVLHVESDLTDLYEHANGRRKRRTSSASSAAHSSNSRARLWQNRLQFSCLPSKSLRIWTACGHYSKLPFSQIPLHQIPFSQIHYDKCHYAKCNYAKLNYPICDCAKWVNNEGFNGFEGLLGFEGSKGSEGFEGFEGSEGSEGSEGFKSLEGFECNEGNWRFLVYLVEWGLT